MSEATLADVKEYERLTSKVQSNRAAIVREQGYLAMDEKSTSVVDDAKLRSLQEEKKDLIKRLAQVESDLMPFASQIRYRDQINKWKSDQVEALYDAARLEQKDWSKLAYKFHSSNYDPTNRLATAEYLASQNIPFGDGVRAIDTLAKIQVHPRNLDITKTLSLLMTYLQETALEEKAQPPGGLVIGGMTPPRHPHIRSLYHKCAARMPPLHYHTTNRRLIPSAHPLFPRPFAL